MSASICANSFSYPSFLCLRPIVSTILTCVSFWYSLLTSSHLCLSPSRNALISLSERQSCIFDVLHADSLSSCIDCQCFPLSCECMWESDHSLSSLSNQPVMALVWRLKVCSQSHSRQWSSYLTSIPALVSHGHREQVPFCDHSHRKSCEAQEVISYPSFQF